MADNAHMAAKKPHLAWRITRVVLHILGIVALWALVIAGTLALIVGIAGSIFFQEASQYLKDDVIPSAYEYAENLSLSDISLAQTSILYYTDKETGEP